MYVKVMLDDGLTWPCLLPPPPTPPALGHPLEKWPPFMSNLVLELWQDPAKTGVEASHVRVLYNFIPLPLVPDKPGASVWVVVPPVL